MTKPGQLVPRQARVEISLLVKVAFEDIDEFVEHYATNISRGGIFIQCRDPKPKGAILLFEIRLKGGKTAIRGKGEVVWTRAQDPKKDQEHKVSGMGVRFLALDKSSKAIVNRILEIKAGRRRIEPSPSEQPEQSELGEAPQRFSADDLDVDIEVDTHTESQEHIGDANEIEVDISVDDFVEPTEEFLRLARAERLPRTALPCVMGIDLGTSNSCAATIIDGKPWVIPSRKGCPTIPSMVAYSDNGQLLVGHAAEAQVELNPRNTLVDTKRLLGRHFSSPAVQQIKDRFQYEIIQGANQDAAVSVVGQERSLREVTAHILKEFRNTALEMLGKQIRQTVISVPACYNHNQRQAVREAGMIADLQVELVSEPIAAALAFGHNRKPDERVLVYDLGGGTFDVAVLNICKSVYEVISTEGDSLLGGVDFDNQLMDYALVEFCQKAGAAPRLDRAGIQRLRNAAGRTKWELSEKEQASIQLSRFASVNEHIRDLEVQVNRSVLELLVAPLVERSMQTVAQVLKKADLTATMMDEILLVGGQSRMPLIRRRLQQLFNQEPCKWVHPDESVAIGAAWLANSIGKLDGVVLIDTLPESIGYGLPGGGMRKVMLAGNPLPYSVTVVASTSEDDQTSMEYPIFQGESLRVLDNEYLGTMSILGISPAPKGRVRLKLTFSLDKECMLRVSCCELEGEKENPTSLAMKHDQAGIRRLLGIPDNEVCTQQLGVPLVLRNKKGEEDSFLLPSALGD